MIQDDFGLDKDELKKQADEKANFEREEKLRISDMRKVLSIPEGRRTVWKMLERCKVFADSFSLNSIEMAKIGGQRSIGISLLSDIELAKPGIVMQMMSEAMSRENSAKTKEKQDDS
jgi:hypothetical protein